MAARKASASAAAGLLLLLLGLLSLEVSQAARALRPSEQVGRKLHQSSCTAANVHFLQDAACQFNVGANNNIGLWTTVIKHDCADDLTALKMEVSVGWPFTQGGPYAGIVGLEGCSGDSSSGLCQLASRTIYQGPYQNTDNAVIELGSLPMSRDSQYSIWYLSAEHPCGSTNFAPYYFNAADATFGALAMQPRQRPTAAPQATTPPPTTPAPTVSPTGSPTSTLFSSSINTPPAPSPTFSPTDSSTTPAPTTPAPTTPAPTGPTPAPTLSGGVPYQFLPNTAIYLNPMVPPDTALNAQCTNGGFSIPYNFGGDGLQCFEHCVFGNGAYAASYGTFEAGSNAGCCFCYTTVPAAADLGPAGDAPGINSFVL